MYLDGHAAFVGRMKAIRGELDDAAGRQIDLALDYLALGRAARRRIDAYAAAADRNDSRRTELFAEWERSAASSIWDVPSYGGWRAESERLLAAGCAILADAKTYGPHLAAGDLVSWTVREIEEAHERDDAACRRNSRYGTTISQVDGLPAARARTTQPAISGP